MDYKEYLEQVHFEQNPHVLDDDLTEHFNGWVSNLDLDEQADLITDYIWKETQKDTTKVVDAIKSIRDFYF